MSQTMIVAIVQHAPVHLDLNGSLQKALGLIEKAAQHGAELVVFGECWLSGYPSWLDHCPEVALWNHQPMKDAFIQLYQNSVQVPGPEIGMIAEMAKRHSVSLVIGVNEVVASGIGNSTVYNSLLTIGSNGELLNHHRKLMPTFSEKLLYGIGDGNGLKAVQAGKARVGGLICWEHWMPLSRQALHNSGEQIHVAVWPEVHTYHQLASRHYAFEGRCFVVAAGQMFRAGDTPKSLTLPDHLAEDPDQMLLRGGSCVIGPDGGYIIEPTIGSEGILMAELDLTAALGEKMTLDTAGHYNRNDIFDFSINSKRPV